MAADLRVARADCGKFGLPEVALGVLPENLPRERWVGRHAVSASLAISY